MPARAERLGPSISDDLAHQLPRPPGPSDDLLDADALRMESPDRVLFSGSALPAVILDALGGRQRGRFDCVLPEGAPHIAHAALHSDQEGRARVLHQVPAVGDLNGIRPALRGGGAISAAAVAGDDLDARMRGDAAFLNSRCGDERLRIQALIMRFGIFCAPQKDRCSYLMRSCMTPILLRVRTTSRVISGGPQT